MNRFASLAVVALGLAAAAPAGAQPTSVRLACRSDVQQYCPSVAPWAIKRCMQAHSAHVSSQCKAAWKAAHPQESAQTGAQLAGPPSGQPQ
ncbi:MAG: hypothetical protein JO127_03050 [Caulobacteraceae bacterium]|nr:hypothetical protein [Caulobacteraceae bacterium]